jgi:beta-phosphoglucomutase
VSAAREPRPRAVALDYNGTLSDDEALLESIYLEVLAEAGAPIDAAAYRAHLLGLPDADMVREGLRLGGVPEPHADRCGPVLAARLARYAAAVAAAPTITADAAAFVRALAAHLPVAVVSGAPRAEVEAGLHAAALRDAVAVIVAAEDAGRGKPAPDPYLLAVERLRDGRPGLQAHEVLAIEDATPGVTAARAAGLRCAGIAGGLGADLVLDGLGERTAALILGAPVAD